jgi:hypothetical protein
MAVAFKPSHYIAFNGVVVPDYARVNLFFDVRMPRLSGEVTGNRRAIHERGIYPEMHLYYDRLSYKTFQWWYQWTGEEPSQEIVVVTLPYPLASATGSRPFHATFAKGMLWQIQLREGNAALYGEGGNARTHWHEGGADIWIKELTTDPEAW